MSEGRAGPIESDGPMCGLDFVEYLEYGRGKALDGVDHLPGPGDGQWGQSVEGTVNQSISIEEKQ